jgi:hypothetical protein
MASVLTFLLGARASCRCRRDEGGTLPGVCVTPDVNSYRMVGGAAHVWFGQHIQSIQRFQQNYAQYGFGGAAHVWFAQHIQAG